jgi:enoyl-CoA hydratase/carnithine racemase
MALIDYREANGIAYITFNRPEKLNALTDDMIVDLKQVLYRFDDSPDAMVAILSGNGRAFCSGADVRQRQLRSHEEMIRLGSPQGRGSHLDELMYRFVNYKPIITAVHGYVLGAGLYIAMLSEFIVAAEGTRFQVTETGRGWSATNFTALLSQRATGGFTDEVMLTGRFWDAEEAYRNNAINRLAPHGKHLEVAERLALDEIMPNPPLAVRAIVEDRRGRLEQLELQARRTQNTRLHLTEDYHESALAFAEKRKPTFHGR